MDSVEPIKDDIEEDNKPLIKFCSEILNVYERNNINGHIKWKKQGLSYLRILT